MKVKATVARTRHTITVTDGTENFFNGMCTVKKDQINADLLAFIGSA